MDTEGVEADIDQGILTVSIPKSAMAKPRQIEVKTAANDVETVEG